MRKLLGTLLIVGVCFWAAKKVHLFSYAGTFWSQCKSEAKLAVPTRFEIERVRREIAALDGDVSRMIRPIAEYVASVNRLKKDIQTGQTNLEDQKATLLQMTSDLEGNSPELFYAGISFSRERVKAKLERDLTSYKRLETNVQSQVKLLEAKETSLKATQDQLAKVMAKKREFEVRLAQLEAEAETLQISKIGSKLQIDDSRTTQIQAALDDLQHRIDTDTIESDLVAGTRVSDDIPVHQRNQPKMDLTAIRNYLEGKAASTVSNK